MKTVFTQKLPLRSKTSFVARTYRTPEFEVGWHQHPEIELILHTEGAGQYYIGNSVGGYETGDIFLLGSDLPHTFQKSGDGIASAVVVQFKPAFWSEGFLNLPELEEVRELFNTALQGLRISTPCREQLADLITALENEEGFMRIITLGQCLEKIARSKNWETISTQELKSLNLADRERLEKVFQYSFDHFKEAITLDTVAKLAALSVPAFCNYFKKRTQKTYMDFLNEVRISYACKLLTSTSLTVTEIAFESGYNTLAHFYRQFKHIVKTTPQAYKTSRLGVPL